MLTIVCGGFYGDEGKGKIVGYLSEKDSADYVVRAGGGPQAGHTVTNGMKVSQIPSGFINKNSRLLIARGTVINPKIVLEEIEKYKEYDVANRIGIDYGCTIIEDRHIEEESELVKRIGSVGTGAGPARADRILRKAKLSQDIPELKPFLTDVAGEINDAVMNKREGKTIIVEGVQGYCLSLMNSKYYPFVTSQITEASQFAADVGIGPKAVDEIIVVYKSYISRVGLGPLRTEWSARQKEDYEIEEKGTISGRQRRLGNFDFDIAKQSIIRNTATQAALTNIDRSFKGNTNARTLKQLTTDAFEFVEKIRCNLEKCSPFYRGITLISTGPDLDNMIDLR